MHIADHDLTLIAMSALPEAEMAAARAHVAGCARCKGELQQIEIALAAYAQTTPEVDIPSGARQRFMARVAQDEKPSPAPQPVKAPEKEPPQRLSWLGRWMPALAGAMAILLAIVSYDDMQKRAEIGPLVAAVQHGQVDSAKLNELMELLSSAQAQRVALHEKPAPAPPPEGRVVYSARNGKLLLTAQNLHPLPSGKVYELWILQPGGKAPVPAGTFAPDSRGNAAMILADEPANLEVAGFGVTVENEGGAQTPTPPIILSGQ